MQCVEFENSDVFELQVKEQELERKSMSRVRKLRKGDESSVDGVGIRVTAGPDNIG